MRRPLLVLLLVASAFLVAACASESSPGWTYAPPTEAPAATPAPSADAGEPTAVPGGTETEPPTDGGNADGVIKVVAVNIAFEPTELTAPADAPFVIEMDNQDAGIPHNVEIKDPMNMSVFMGEIVTGPIVTQYQVQALPAGAYAFVCTVHPNMVGNLTVGG
jgi:plastocyanin